MMEYAFVGEQVSAMEYLDRCERPLLLMAASSGKECTSEVSELDAYGASLAIDASRCLPVNPGSDL